MPPPTCGTTPGGTSWATTTESAFGAARETGVGKTGVFRELGEKSEGTGVKFGRSRAERGVVLEPVLEKLLRARHIQL